MANRAREVFERRRGPADAGLAESIRQRAARSGRRASAAARGECGGRGRGMIAYFSHEASYSKPRRAPVRFTRRRTKANSVALAPKIVRLAGSGTAVDDTEKLSKR